MKELLNKMTFQELAIKSEEMKKELFGMKMQHSLGHFKNTAQLRTLRKDIARAMTIMHMKRGENEKN